ncbi:MAG: hypothetical protein M3340_06655 [Actinomycetota bacterium]|nr:hypothetical protein [Actinomycetota bacterium]
MSESEAATFLRLAQVDFDHGVRVDDPEAAGMVEAFIADDDPKRVGHTADVHGGLWLLIHSAEGRRRHTFS